MKSKDKNAGFTLVELLVVIGIIALLISILLPALSKARQQAGLVACAAKMRQLANAVMLYSVNNKGSYPPTAATGFNSTYNRPTLYPAGGEGLLIPYLGKITKTTVSGSGSSSDKLYVCPAQLDVAPTDNTNAGYTYKYNNYIGGAEPNSGFWFGTPMKVGRVRQSSNMALFVEGPFYGTIGRPMRFKREKEDNSNKTQNITAGEEFYLHSEKRLTGTYNAWWNASLKYPNRSGITNIAFADGSVRAVPMSIKASPLVFPSGVYIDPKYPMDKW